MGRLIRESCIGNRMSSQDEGLADEGSARVGRGWQGLARVAVLTLVLFLTLAHPCSPLLPPVFSEPLLVDDFETPTNKLNGRSDTYVQEPSRALQVRTSDEPHDGRASLMLKYDKKGKGGPYDSGGWCGYYTQVKSGRQFFDASGFTALTFWVKGAHGDECFMVGIADRHWDEVGDSVKSEVIGKYLPEGKITTDWQQATVPLSTFFVDMKELATVAICFESACFPEGQGKGTVYLDDLQFE